MADVFIDAVTLLPHGFRTKPMQRVLKCPRSKQGCHGLITHESQDSCCKVFCRV